jgi:1,2-diacylglycerol 3-beta-galactosyltransferase
MWKEHTPWPFNTFPDSYSFMVKHEWIWKLAFDFSSPKFVHQPHFVATTAFVARWGREIAFGCFIFSALVTPF